MIFKPTEAERKKIEELQARYLPEHEKRNALLNATTDKEERRKLLTQLQAVQEQEELEIAAFLEEAERKRLKPIIAAGPDAIISHAQEQMALLLEDLPKMIKFYHHNSNAFALREAGIATIKGDKILANANYATAYLKDELRLHIEALKDSPEALQKLLEYIIEAVEASEYTDNAEITDTQQGQQKYMRFRRSPLAEITTYGLMNDKINAQLIQEEGKIFQQATDGQMSFLWVVEQAAQHSIDKKQSVPVKLMLTYEGTEGKITKSLTAFDKQVYEAIATRFYYWQQDNPQKPLYITPQEIWRTMNGKLSRDGQAKPSATQVKRICDSIDKMRFTRFYMDISAEIEAFNLFIDDERITSGRIETYVLNSSKVEFTTDKGNTVQGYRIGEEPIIYTYNKAKKHILYVPYEMLDTSKHTSDSENVTEFKGYLLQQIQLMKNAAGDGKKGKRFKRNNTILLETIYKGTGILPPEERIAQADENGKPKEYKTEASRQKEIRRFRMADRQKIEGLLDAWTDKGWIKGYTVLNQKGEPIKEKQQAKGYSINI